MNKVILIGNLGADPEVRHLQDGIAVANFTLATSEVFKDKNTGERREQTEWHRVVAWRRLADLTEKYLKKGSKVYVEGKLRTRKWEKDGIDRYTTEIMADEMTLLDRRETGAPGADQPQAPRAAAAPTANAPMASASEELDDLPF